MKKYWFIIFLCLPCTVLANNIGLSGSPNFLSRQKIIDNLVLQLKQNLTNQTIKNEIIQNFGDIGIENLIRYNEPCLKDIFLLLLKNPDFYVRYKSLYALRRSGNLELDKIQYILNSTNLLLKDMLLSTLTENYNDANTNMIKEQLNNETNIYLKNDLLYAYTNIKHKNQKIFSILNYEIEKSNLVYYKYYKSGTHIDNYQENIHKYFSRISIRSQKLNILYHQ